MKFADHLTKEQIQKFNQLRRAEREKKRIQKKQNKKAERFSIRDIEDLMGTHRDTYKRVNGALRRK